MNRRNFLKRYSLLPFVGSLAAVAKAEMPLVKISDVIPPLGSSETQYLMPSTRLDLVLYAVKSAKEQCWKIERIEATPEFIAGLHLDVNSSYNLESPIYIDGHLISPYPPLHKDKATSLFMYVCARQSNFDLMLICDKGYLGFSMGTVKEPELTEAEAETYASRVLKEYNFPEEYIK